MALPNARKLKTGLILAAHGNAQGDHQNSALQAHANILRATGSFEMVEAGVLTGQPALTDILTSLSLDTLDQLLIFPHFMANGYFVETALPTALKSSGLQIPHHILTPTGLLKGLAPLIISKAMQMAAEHQSNLQKTRLLIVGHGSSKSRASHEATCQIVAQISSDKSGIFADVRPCFLEEPPFFKDMICPSHGSDIGRAGSDETDITSVITVGFFTGDGMHGKNDVQKIIREAQCAGQVEILNLPPVGTWPEISDLILEKALAAEAK